MRPCGGLGRDAHAVGLNLAPPAADVPELRASAPDRNALGVAWWVKRWFARLSAAGAC
ncbi:hypothetical protein HUW46_02080 [Amycolatopsis sp. CA-230715]|nr:hypothetical protein HUW46_02080 [Amycolatopsis sp. CA-230715]